MNLPELEQQLLFCLSSQDTSLQNAAKLTQEYTELMKSGQISSAEYTQLLSDIQSQVIINQNMAEMEAKERLNVAINGLLNLAKLV